MSEPQATNMSEEPEKSLLWPGMVIALLLLSVGVGMSLLYAAHFVDQGPQIEEDYYARAVAWDDHRAMLEHGLALGWELDVRPREDQVEVTIHDAGGQPVSGVEGELTVRRASESAPRLRGALRAREGGGYVLEGSIPGSGLWDFFVDVPDVAGAPARFALRRELR